ncbi:MAG: hypothetical protein M3N19_08925, partial [Candidatus Eremiobacteraeota bacterium]|nr:hypothetical protein [Candidatus Eremiobacteraeota bacterium]
ACGGGGGTAGAGSPGNPKVTSKPTSQPTSIPRDHQVHIVIGFSTGKQTTQVVPGAGDHAAVLPKNGQFTDGGPLAGARIAYPDGSIQIADSRGVFRPADSAYALKNQKMLQTNPQAQPLVIVSDPSGKAKPSTARVAAYASAIVPTSAVVRSTRAATMGTIQNLAGISLLQPTSSIFSSDSLSLDVEGSDINNNTVDLSTATVTYSSATPQGGTVIPIAGTTEAYYFPPSLGGGSATDTINVTVSVPGTTTPFTASNSVLVVAAADAVQVSGSIQTASATPMPGSVALFAQVLKHNLPPNYWLASADDTGNYSVGVPANQIFSLILGTPPQFSPTASFDYFVGASTADGSVTSYPSGGPGLASLNLFLPTSAVIFNNAPSDSLPSYVGFVRDAWYNTVDASQLRIFDAGSGIQPILAAVPTTFPSPAAPTPVGSGQLANWCYQWEQLGGAATLVVAEASGANCSQPGNDGFTIQLGPAAGSYSFVKYTSNTSYTIAAPLDVVTNALLVKSGSWQQTLTGAPSSITSDLASVQEQLYDAANQVFGSPVYSETLSYAYSLNGGLSSEQYTNDTRVSAADGSTVALYNATKTQVDALPGCAPCYTITGAVQENFDPASGVFHNNYSISGSLNSDGSALLTYQSQSDASKIVIPLATNTQQNASPYCLVCAGNPASVFDTDGTSKVGSFTVSNARLVQFFVLDPAQGGLPVDSLGFIL